MPQTPERLRGDRAARSARAGAARRDLRARSTPWQCVQVARHPNRPCMLDYVERLFTGLHRAARRSPLRRRQGHRRRASAFFHGAAGRGRRPPEGPRHEAEDLPELRLREARGLSQGAARDAAGREVPPAGHRRSSTRRRPIRASSRRSAASPKRSRSTCARWRCSTCRSSSIVCGEGGSGGALGIAVGDRVLMQEFSVYSVIPPEGCAAILWRDAKRKVEAAEALKITAPDLLGAGPHRRNRQGAVGRRAPRTTTRRRRSSTRRSGGICAS